MIEDAPLVSVVLAGDVAACLLVEPPAGESEVGRDLHSLFVDDPARLEHRVDVAGDAASIVSQGHSGAARDEGVYHDASANEALTQRGECPLKVCPTKEHTCAIPSASGRPHGCGPSRQRRHGRHVEFSERNRLPAAASEPRTTG
jgi:hypothetical protein